MKTFAAVFTAAIVGLSFVPVIAETEEGIPRVIAYVGKDQQRGRMWSSSSSSESPGGGCVHGFGHGVPVFPKRAATFRAPGTIHIRFFREDPPTSVSISVWRRVHERSRLAAGGSRHPAFRLEPWGEEGQTVAWDAVFDASKARHYYVDVSGEWTDAGPCGGPQEASWVFHLEGR